MTSETDFQRRHPALLADEDAHARRAGGALEQLQDLALAGEGLEQIAQAIQVRQVLHAHQAGLAGEHDIVAAAGRERLFGQFDRVREQRFHLAARAARSSCTSVARMSGSGRPAKCWLR